MSLKDYLSEIASAIRSKTKKTEPINAQNFAEEIMNISTAENLDEPLNTQNEKIAKLEQQIEDLNIALDGKTSGAGSRN